MQSILRLCALPLLYTIGMIGAILLTAAYAAIGDRQRLTELRRVIFKRDVPPLADDIARLTALSKLGKEHKRKTNVPNKKRVSRNHGWRYWLRCDTEAHPGISGSQHNA